MGFIRIISRGVKHMFFKHTGIQFRIYPHNSISTPVSFWGWYTYSLFRIPAWSWLLRFRDRLCSFVGIRYHWLLLFFLFTSHGTLAYPMVSQGFTNLQMAQSLKCLLELMIFPFQRWDLSWFPAHAGQCHSPTHISSSVFMNISKGRGPNQKWERDADANDSSDYTLVQHTVDGRNPANQLT